jgi:hypothetical protein
MAYPLSTSLTRAEALMLPYVGCTTLEVDRSNALFSSISTFYGFTSNDKIDAFEIKLKPQKRHEITSAFKKVIHKTTDAGLRKFIIKAKADLEAALADYYIVGNGYLSDSVSKGTDVDIYNEVVKRLESNTELIDAIGDYDVDAEFVTAEIKDIQHYFDPVHWAGVIDSINNDWHGP